MGHMQSFALRVSSKAQFLALFLFINLQPLSRYTIPSMSCRPLVTVAQQTIQPLTQLDKPKKYTMVQKLDHWQNPRQNLHSINVMLHTETNHTFATETIQDSTSLMQQCQD